MEGMIDGLLEYSRVGKDDTDMALTDVQDVLRQALANVQMAVRESGATVTWGVLPTVRSSALLLAELFQNLIENAIKFRGDGPPQVHVSAERKGPEWIFFVRDNGIGIDPQHAERIFTIFQRLHTRDKY